MNNDDYPWAAIRAGEQGAVAFELDVDATGAVTECRLLSTSGSTTLDTATCDLMRARAEFLPARDATGRPIPAHYRNVFRWELP